MNVAVILLVLITCAGSLDAVVTCPDNCFCLSDTKVICNGGGLADLPLNLPDTVEELSFDRNNLSSLTTDMFREWRKLRDISLNDNQIRIIKPFAFRGLGHLKKIFIQNNPLTELPQFAFAGLENVSQINLCNNKISNIQSYVFAGSRNLGMILIQDNPLIRIQAKAFSGLRTVQFIYLPSWVKVIESDSFFDLQGVGLLRLHSLDLHALRPYTFRGLKNVTQISIQESDLGIVKDKAFEGLYNVGELRIINNKVDELESLEVLEESNVDGVIVQGNHFLQVNKEQPFRIHANQRTVVTGNYVPCSCQLWWVLESPLAKNNSLFIRHNYCVSPFVLHGKAITIVDQENLPRCPASQELQLPSNQDPSKASSATASASTTSINNAIFFILIFPFW
ncbi:leucine-rich repeat and immunoglobulin-like domain-containing nogo receptor-interacting protein 1 isoform X2 [Macrobrachium rosenbergii]